MTDHIEFRDDAFSFRQDGITYHVHTEVGDGPAWVVVEEVREPQQQDIDWSSSE